MPRSNSQNVIAFISATGERAPPASEKLALLASLAEQEQQTFHEQLVDTITQLVKCTRSQQQDIEHLRDLLRQLTHEPWYPATFLRFLDDAEPLLAEVHCDNSMVVVSIDQSLTHLDLLPGDGVYLAQEKNHILKKSQFRPANGQSGEVTRVLDDDLIMVREQDREISLRRGGRLLGAPLQPGQTVMFQAGSHIAVDTLPEAGSEGVREVDTATLPVPFVGHPQLLDDLLAGFECCFRDPQQAAAYGLANHGQHLLLHGLPGNGKTLLAGHIAHVLDACLLVVNASAWFSMWVGQTERNIVRDFDLARRKHDEGQAVVLFIDEIDALGRRRGDHNQQHADRAVSQLLTQLDGAAGKPGFAVIGACNRPELLDSAFDSRLSRRLYVPSPDMAGVREIAAAHLHEQRCYAGKKAREQSIDALVARLVLPNADNAIATVQLRSGELVEVKAADMLSGRAIAQIADNAAERAFVRSARGGKPGISPRDVELAVEGMIERWRATLTPRNASDYLPNLPHDVAVTAVQAVRGQRSVDYINEVS